MSNFESVYAFVGQEQVASPQLVFYPEIIRENIRIMKALAGDPGRLWPHIKTHKSKDVTALLVSEGIRRFKCATISELEMAADAGAEALVLAYPLVGPNIERFLSVREAFPEVRFYAIGDSIEALTALGRAALSYGRPVDVLLDTDMGQHRTGIPVSEITAAYTAYSKIEGIRLCGLHCYDGHRHESNAEIRMAGAKGEDTLLVHAVEVLKEKGYRMDIVILGGTPSFPCHQETTSFYLSPGTCVIQDAGYQAAYPDLPFTPAAAVLTRVVSRPTKDTFTVDLGTKAVASDPLEARAVIDGMPFARMLMHNEEHMVFQVSEAHIADIPGIGTELFAVPTHICPTAALYPYAETVCGGRLCGQWEITARNRRITY